MDEVGASAATMWKLGQLFQRLEALMNATENSLNKDILLTFYDFYRHDILSCCNFPRACPD